MSDKSTVLGYGIHCLDTLSLSTLSIGYGLIEGEIGVLYFPSFWWGLLVSFVCYLGTFLYTPFYYFIFPISYQNNNSNIMVAGTFQVKVFKQQNYLHNFVQSSFNALSPERIRGRSSIIYVPFSYSE